MWGGPGRWARVGLLAFWSQASVAERFNAALYANDSGLPQRQVLAIAQDSTGYLWVGTYGGLSRFNGRAFFTLRTTEGLASNSIFDLVPLPGDRLWVGTAGGGVCLVEGLKALRCFRAPDLLPSDDVLDLEPDGQGGVWVGTFDGVAHLRADGSHHTFRSVEGQPLRDAWSVKRVGEEVWIGFVGGLARVRESQVERLPVNLPCGGVRALLPAQSWVYLGCERGLWRLLPNGASFRLEEVGGGLAVQDLSLAGNEVWVTTRSGALRWDGRRLRRIGVEHGLPSEVVHRVFQDREGVLWLGTEAGLVKLMPGPFVTYTTADGLPHPFVRALAVDRRGRLWVGTRGGLAVAEGERFKPILPNELQSSRVYALLPLPTGDLWVATNRGTFQLREDRLVRVWQEKDGLPDRFTFALAFDPAKGELYLGTWAGMACLKNNQLVPLPSQLAEARPLAMHVDRQGRLWVSLRDGKVLLRDADGRLRALGSKEGLSDQVAWCIASDAHGVWLGTNGDGAFHITGSGIDRWDRRRGLVDDFVWQVLPDRRGRVWFYTSQGLDRLEGGSIKHFGLHDGLPELEGSANACYEDPSGRLWFGTASGLARFDPAQEQAVTSPPPVLLEQATFGQGQPLREGARVPADAGPIVFSLVSLSFRNERSLRWSFRLLPVQDQWSPPQPQGEITFAALGPGRYRFEAVAIDGDGRRSPTPAAVSFSVAAPWWLRLPFLLGLGALVAAAGFAATRWRLRRLQAKAAELERLVAERTQELARLAETDELTGLPNRRKFFVTLRAELQRLWRAPSEARLCLLLLDLDGFKTINDTLGHHAGDALLQAVAKALASAVRATDTVARFGGDEFAIILPMTDRAGGAVVAGKTLQAVRETHVAYGEHRLQVTASAGLAVVAPSASFNEEEVTRLIQRADVALYAAKRRGGDAVLDDQETWA